MEIGRKHRLAGEKKAELLAWVRENYSRCQSLRIPAEMFGVSINTVKYWGAKLGLKRDFTRVECVKYGLRRKLELLKTLNGGSGLKELRKRQSEARTKVYRSEKRRVQFGLPQKTKMRIGENEQLTYHRYRLRKHGYVVDDEKRIAYWTDATARCLTCERKERFYKFAPLGTEVETKPKKVYVRPAYDGDIYFNQ